MRVLCVFRRMSEDADATGGRGDEHVKTSIGQRSKAECPGQVRAEDESVSAFNTALERFVSRR